VPLTKVPQSQIDTLSIGTAQLADGALSADAAGRAKMADGFVATAELADGALSADAAGRAKMADGFMTQAKMAANVAGTGPAFSVYLSANQTVASGVITKVALNTEEFDTANAFDSTTNYRFQPAVAGYYMLTAHIGASASTAGTVFVPYIYKNGSAYKVGQSYIPPSGSSSMNGSITALVYLNGTTDYVELWGNNTGSGTNTFSGGASTTWFQGAMVRAA
jgi:hypothetical protein